ncbi:MAG: ABC transporter ATP-binding protein [Spirochaetota bacterium]|nr:ABC transporter ATP-binding protein [Spirochaetota bacterium]
MNQEYPILKLTNVSFRYDNQPELLSNISFSTAKHQISIIVGPSGTGKSTLLKLCNRLIDCSEGDIHYNGLSIYQQSPLQIRKKIGYLPQIPYLTDDKVRDNILISFQQKDISDNNSRDIIRLLREVGLSEEYLERSSLELSVGEKQRIAIVRTLMNNSKILLLDEPNSALDEDNSVILIRCLKRLVLQEGVSLIVVTHNLDFARKLGGRFLLLKGGSLVEVNDPSESFMEGKQ